MELDNLRALSHARQAEERRMSERRKAVLVLVLRYLVDAGYVESYERLSSECNLSLQRVGLATAPLSAAAAPADAAIVCLSIVAQSQSDKPHTKWATVWSVDRQTLQTTWTSCASSRNLRRVMSSNLAGGHGSSSAWKDWIALQDS